MKERFTLLLFLALFISLLSFCTEKQHLTEPGLSEVAESNISKITGVKSAVVHDATTSISPEISVTGSLSANCAYGTWRDLEKYFLNIYSFAATVGQTAAITMESEDFDTFLYLYKKYEESDTVFTLTDELAFNDDYARNSLNSKIVYDIQETGTHYIVASSNSSCATGNFILELELSTSGPTVTSPTSSDTYLPGQSFTVSWIGFSGSSVRIELYQGNTYISELDASAYNGGYYFWLGQFAGNLSYSAEYRIRVTSTSDPSQSAYSSCFTIGSGPTVISPTTKDIWLPGNTYTIRWSGFTGSTVEIKLYIRGHVPYIICNSTSNTGSRSWEVPSDLSYGTCYFITIFTLRKYNQEASSNYFTIGSAP